MTVSRIAVGERREDAEVGSVAAAKEEGAWQDAEFGEALLRRMVRAEVAADEGRSAGAHAALVDGAVSRRPQRRMVGEPEVVVAGKVDHGAPVLADSRSLRRIDDAANALQVAALQIGEALGQPSREAAHRRQAGSRPSAANSASSRATSGLPVVRSFSP